MLFWEKAFIALLAGLSPAVRTVNICHADTQSQSCIKGLNWLRKVGLFLMVFFSYLHMTSFLAAMLTVAGRT